MSNNPEVSLNIFSFQGQFSVIKVQTSWPGQLPRVQTSGIERFRGNPVLILRKTENDNLATGDTKKTDA